MTSPLVFALAWLASVATAAPPLATPSSTDVMALTRSACRGMCPSYRVEIHGDGRMLYEGFSHVDAIGKERYQLPPGEMSKLVQSAMSKNLMSLRENYSANFTDLPTNTLQLTLGGKSHQIIDYVGVAAGMPASVTQFQNEIDDVLQRAMRQRLSPQGLAQLAAQGFAFDTAEGINLLRRAARAASNSRDEDWLAVFDMLTPARMSGPQKQQAGAVQEGMANTATWEGRTALVRQMVMRGALLTAGKHDKRKIDRVFFTAVSAGRPDLVSMLVHLPDGAPRPALDYIVPAAAPGKPGRRQSLLFLLSGDRTMSTPARDFAVARLLIENGCNPRARADDGDTLLHIAARSNDPAFVRYVLGLGVEPSRLGVFGMPALGSTSNEEVAMLLLEAGTSKRALNTLPGFRESSQKQNWTRVLAWLKAHGR